MTAKQDELLKSCIRFKQGEPFPYLIQDASQSDGLGRASEGQIAGLLCVERSSQWRKLRADGPAEMPAGGTEFEAAVQLDEGQVMLRVKT